MSDCPSDQAIVGRFAPSPTGDLHFGSLIAAMASYLQAKARGGSWLIRMEDIDPPREVPGSAERILGDLRDLGFISDLPVLYQSERTRAYQEAVELLLDRGLAFHCGCSRADLPTSGIYPGTCRNGLQAGKPARSVRLRVSNKPIRFTDGIQGPQQQILSESIGDFVIWRADGLPAYQLAVAVDDAFQQISEVVRGADLLNSTARQIHVLNCLGLAAPRYAHHPVVIGQDGQKMSKRWQSDPINSLSPAQALESAMELLGLPCPPGMDIGAIRKWALDNWQLSGVPRQKRFEAEIASS